MKKLTDDIVKSYLSRIDNTRLTVKEERELSSLIFSDTASEKEKERAINELASKNLKLVIKEAFSYAKKTHADVEDLIAAGNYGLMRGVYRYNYEKYKTKFSTYAVFWIRWGITKFLYDSSFVVIPNAIVDKSKKYKKLIAEGIVNEEAIKDALKISSSELNSIKLSLVSQINLDEPIVNKDGQHSSFAEVIEDENAVAPSEEVEQNEKFDHVLQFVDELDEIQKDIIRSRYLSSDKIKLADLGKKHGMTGENVRLIENKALAALKSRIKEMA